MNLIFIHQRFDSKFFKFSSQCLLLAVYVAMTPGVMTSALPIPTRLSSTRMRMVIPPLSQRGAWAMPEAEPENRLGTATYRRRIWRREDLKTYRTPRGR